MKLKNRVAYYFVSRLFLLMLIWGLLIVLSVILFSFFLGDKKKDTSPLSISHIVEQTNVIDQELSIGSKLEEDLKNNQMWMQVLDEQGNEAFSFNKPKSIPDHYIPGELVSDYLYPAKKGFQLSTWYKTLDNQELTWVLGKPMTNHNPFQYWANNLWVLSVIIMGIIMALFFGRQLGAPLLYIVAWIENLSIDKYEKPKSDRGWRSKNETKTYKELTQALSKLTSTLQRNREERKVLEKTREEWMTGVSHDLKTPLSVIKGYTVLLSSNEHDWEQDKVRHFSKIMEERVEYMEQLIEDFNLTFQLKNDAIPIQLEQKDLVHAFKNLLEQLRKTPESSNKMVSFETNKEQIFLPMNTKFLKRAFENLLANSIKHNPSETSIKVILQEDPSQIRIGIEDDGVGMDQQTIDHLFDRYYRGTNATANTSGTGLGMAIARQIIIAHGGTIDINSRPQQGTQCLITFPR